MRRLSRARRSKTKRVATAAWRADSSNLTLPRRFLRQTMPPVSVNQISPVVALSRRRVPLVRSRLAST
jgi:hypothetical protein